MHTRKKIKAVCEKSITQQVNKKSAPLHWGRRWQEKTRGAIVLCLDFFGSPMFVRYNNSHNHGAILHIDLFKLNGTKNGTATNQYVKLCKPPAGDTLFENTALYTFIWIVDLLEVKRDGSAFLVKQPQWHAVKKKQPHAFLPL